MNWTELRVEDLDVGEVKDRLPIAYVLERYDVGLDEAADGRLHGLCPFHEDSDPSLDVYGEHLERFGCFACGAGGDVVDLVQRLEGLPDFPSAKARALELLRDLEGSDWSGPTLGVKRVFDAEAALEVVQSSEVSQSGAVTAFLLRRTDPGLSEIDPEWLQAEFRVGSRGDELVIPYYGRKGELITYKHRPPGGKALAVSGSSFGAVLYGEWRDTDTKRPVLLCEGETDVWAAAHQLPEWSVLGLPTGAGARPLQQGSLAGRRVVLAFDGDDAGRRALRAWHTALRSHDADVGVLPLPDGQDVASLPDLRARLSTVRRVPDSPIGLKKEGTTYVRPGKEQNTPLSNWTFEPSRELVGESGMAFEGVLRPETGSGPVILTTDDLASKSSTVRWAAARGGSWYGTERDGQLLLGQLQAEAPFLATGRMDTVAGLHQGHFVWPGGSIGPDHRLYVPPAADVHLGDHIGLDPAPFDKDELSLLLGLHLPDVTHPLLAWLALAPLRSMLVQFPVLAVTGSSGSGKTTMLEVMLRRFTGTEIQSNLTSTTRHAIFAYAGCTNAFPVWFDEYRPGARKDALETIDQVLRDAYTRQGSAKGGMRERWAEVVQVRAEAPMIVSGEDTFSETSHIERMVLVPLPREGRSPEALSALRGRSGLPHRYLTWLHDSLVAGDLPEIVNYELGPEDLQPRQRYNFGALDLGWRVLGQFSQEVLGTELPEPDWSRVENRSREAGAHDPIKDGLLWALEEAGSAEAVVRVGNQILVRTENFVRLARDKGGFVLPGGPTAVRDYLIERYGALQVRSRDFPLGRQVRALQFAAESIGAEEVD